MLRHTQDDLPSSDARLDGAAGLSRQDVLLASIGALVTFNVYLWTMFPGIHDRGDAAKFAFVGPVLGTPHAPGYPLYMMVSYAFSYVPWGSVAFRMNLLSVVLSVAAVTAVYFIARRLGTSRLVAFTSMLALAFGDAYWSRSLYAKGYTLNAALVAAGVLLLCCWGRTRHLPHFYAAAAVFALSAGNHLINVALLPALVLFSLVVDWRSMIRPRTLATVTLLVLAGLAQYLYILIRTVQGAPYLEAQAHNLRELWGVMTARRFAHEIGAFDLRTLADTRWPHISGLLQGEFGGVGLALVGLGLVILAVRRQREAILFGLGAAGVIALTTNMSSNEDEGFLLPALLLMWPLAGVGLEWLLQWVRHAPRAVATAVTIVAVLWLPVWQASRNFAANDHHGELQEARYFDALFAALPDSAAIIDDEYHLNQIVLYKLLGEGQAARHIGLVGADRVSVKRALDAGRTVVAFGEGQRDLSAAGFIFEPFTFPVPPDARKREAFRLIVAGACLDIGNIGWVDLTADMRPSGRMTVLVDNYRPFDATVTIYTGSTSREGSAVLQMTGPALPRADETWFDTTDPSAANALAARSAADGVILPPDLAGQRFVRRLAITANDGGASALLAVDLGTTVRAGRIRAIVDLNSARRARACAHPLGSTDAWPANEQSVRLSPDSLLVGYAAGWYAPEQRPDGLKFRWTDRRASVVLPLTTPRAARVGVVAEPIDYPGRATSDVALVVNGRRFEGRSMTSGENTLEWIVPAQVWRQGLNEVTFETEGARRPVDVGLSQDSRTLGMSVKAITLSTPTGK